MNVNNLIIETLKPLGHPVVATVYTGKEPVYITFNCADDRGEVFADNKPLIDIVYMQIHLFAPDTFNYVSLKKKIRVKLLNAGFTYPQMSSQYEADMKINHIIFECEITGKAESEE